MIESRLYCIMMTGRRITDTIRDLLFSTAYLMVKTHIRRRKVRTDECEGVVRTYFQRACLGDLSGISFLAELDTEDGQVTVSYLVRDRDLEFAENAEGCAWESEEDGLRPRPNPIREVARQHRYNQAAHARPATRRRRAVFLDAASNLAYDRASFVLNHNRKKRRCSLERIMMRHDRLLLVFDLLYLLSHMSTSWLTDNPKANPSRVSFERFRQFCGGLGGAFIRRWNNA